MHRTQLYVPQSLWKSVQQEARSQHVTASEVVRNALAKYFVRVSRKKQPETFLEAVQRINALPGDKAPADLAMNMDHYLYGAPKKYSTTSLWF